MMKRKSFFSAGFMITTASPNRAPTLVPADIEHVAQAGNLRYGQLRAVGHDAVAQPGPVDEQRQAVFPAGVVQSRQLRLGIQGAALGGVRDIHHAGLDNVLSGLVVPVPLHIILHLLGRVIFPSAAGRVMTLWPVDSMAPASWQLMCPLSADSTPCQGRRMEAITVVLVWVPPTRK